MKLPRQLLLPLFLFGASALALGATTTGFSLGQSSVLPGGRSNSDTYVHRSQVGGAGGGTISGGQFSESALPLPIPPLPGIPTLWVIQ
jgi:hypothetical protein